MLEDIFQERLKKLDSLREHGIDPYPSGPFDKEKISEVIQRPVEAAARIAGRVMLFRPMGNIAFAQLQDESGRIQVVFKKNILGEKFKFWIAHLDIGDIIGVAGTRINTNTGEISVQPDEVVMLAKNLHPLPDKHKGLLDDEKRLRQRYLDILLNPEVQDMIYKKDRFWNSVRRFLKDRDFIEVQTPALETTPGGGDARPFITHHNALDVDVKLRISMGELWQKRLMVAGLHKTFEIGRQFRNEGMDAEHLQDYDQMEFYWAYANYESGMQLVKELFRYVAQETFGTQQFSMRGFEIDLAAEWGTYDYVPTIKEFTGIDVFEATLEEMEARLGELHQEYDRAGFNRSRAMDNLWKYCRKKIAGPAFLINEPVEISPLAKRSRRDPRVVERFHVIIGGSELGNGYSELNDPVDQAQRFAEQQRLREAGDEEAQMPDNDFVEALEYAMPPTVGFGMSERVFAFFMDKSMRECQIFPLMKPR